MSLVDIPAEQTTAATDLLLALVAAFCATSLQRYRSADSFKVGIWTWTLAFVAVAAALGAIAHGFEMPPRLSGLIWAPLNLCLGFAVALFCVGALHDGWGRSCSRRVLFPMMCLGVLFGAATTVTEAGFVVFVIYQAIAMTASFLVYLRLTIGRLLRGAAVMTAAVLVNIIAATLQTSESVRFTFVWEFDRNGVFHLVQVTGVLLLCTGLHAALRCAGRQEAQR